MRLQMPSSRSTDTRLVYLEKQDGLGRVCTPATRREELLAEFARSGLSGARFTSVPLPGRCKKETTFHTA
jgi:hypothetical protein